MCFAHAQLVAGKDRVVLRLVEHVREDSRKLEVVNAGLRIPNCLRFFSDGVEEGLELARLQGVEVRLYEIEVVMRDCHVLREELDGWLPEHAWAEEERHVICLV